MATRPLRRAAVAALVRTPHFWLAMLGAVAALTLWDMQRVPGEQELAKAWIRAVTGYQQYLRGATHGAVRCRFRPTCSVYSQAAVGRHGIGRGLVLTVQRIWRCRGDVPLDTEDPLR